MKNNNLAQLTIAIIGNGFKNQYLALMLSGNNYKVVLGVKEEYYDSTKNLIGYSKNISVADIHTAAEQADIIILSSDVKNVRELAYLADNVKDKILIDYSCFNTDNPEEKYEDTLTAIKTITGSNQVVKCYPSNEAVIMMVGDDKKSKKITKIILMDVGVTKCVDWGGSERINLLNQVSTKHMHINLEHSSRHNR
ncbi:MAG: NAD(P)-binding domain-containing protein [Bacteroidetes bacterium]|nr:NAD(P)-binding domain-containing protein [Bacteroidota bacterium]